MCSKYGSSKSDLALYEKCGCKLCKECANINWTDARAAALKKKSSAFIF